MCHIRKLTYQVIRKTAQHAFQTFDNRVLFTFTRLPIEIECTGEDEKNAGYTIVEV